MGRRVRRSVKWLLARAGVRVTGLGRGAYLVRRRTAGDGYDLVDVATDVAVVTRRTLPARDRWQRDRKLFGWLGERHLAEVLAGYQVNCVLDVGANTGQYARMLRRIGYRGHIVSFEPVPQFFAELAANAAPDPLWSVHNLALGSVDDTAEMNVTANTLSSLLPASAYGERRFHSLRRPTTLPVPVRRLDGVLDGVLPPNLDGPRIFLKLDTQGYDVRAFEGLGERHREIVAMQSEMALLRIYEGMPRLPEALSIYERAGFEISGMFPVSRDGGSLRILEYDCLLVRA
jgi:FkbM family methyltransferase